jgi:hypothetical protein
MERVIFVPNKWTLVTHKKNKNKKYTLVEFVEII